MTDGPFDAWLQARADVRRTKGRTRATTATDNAVFDLAGNDYCGLAREPRVVAAAADALGEYGAGARASRVVTGTLPPHVALERELALLTGFEAACVASSGYAANLAALTSLAPAGTAIIADAHVHASIHDAGRLAGGTFTTFEHNDVEAAERAVLHAKRDGAKRLLLVVESVYSVLGDAAPLAQLHRLAVDAGALLVVDEAHGIGVRGGGAGLVAEAGLAGSPHIVLTVTCSKALGSQGGAVLGSDLVREHVVNTARSFIYDTGLAPAAAAAAACAAMILRTEPERTHGVGRAAGVIAEVLGITQSAGAVQSVAMTSAEAAARASANLRAAGIAVGCFRPPSTPDGVSRLRLTARADADPERLRQACRRVREECDGFTHVRDRAVVTEILMRPKDFAPFNALEAVTPLLRPALRRLVKGRFALPPVLANVHGPGHRAVRAAVRELFTTERVEQARGVMQELVSTEAERARTTLDAGGVADLAATVAGLPPTLLMCDMLDVNPAQAVQLKGWSDDALRLFWGWPSADEQLDLADSCVALFGWLRREVLGVPNRFTSAIASVGLDEKHSLSLAFFLFIAGHQTTSYLGATALRDAFSTAQDLDASEVAHATLRYSSSVPTWRRVACRDTDVGTTSFAEGSQLVVHLSGGDADDGANDVELPGGMPGYQLAFGMGLHRCLGAELAVMETEEMVRGAREALGDVRLTADAPWVPHVELLSFAAPRSVPVERER